MNAARTRALLFNEWDKNKTRVSFWLPAGVVLLVALLLLTTTLGADGRMAPPAMWFTALGTLGSTRIFVFIAVILLVGREFKWRTARQGIIDGASRSEWILAKGLVVFLMAAVLCAMTPVVWVLVSLLRTGSDTQLTTLVPSTLWLPLGARFLDLLFVGSFGIFWAIATRGAGVAIGVYLVWVFVEPLLLVGGFLLRISPDVLRYLGFLPMSNADSMVANGRYPGWSPSSTTPPADSVSVSAADSTGASQSSLEIAFEAMSRGSSFPVEVHLIVGLAWTALFFWGAWSLFRVRDL